MRRPIHRALNWHLVRARKIEKKEREQEKKAREQLSAFCKRAFDELGPILTGRAETRGKILTGEAEKSRHHAVQKMRNDFAGSANDSKEESKKMSEAIRIARKKRASFLVGKIRLLAARKGARARLQKMQPKSTRKK